MIGRRVRMTYPDGYLTDASGVILHVSPNKHHPEVWPIGAYCGYLRPSEIAAERERAQVTGCAVRWDAWMDGGELRPLPECRIRQTWVDDARWLAGTDGEPLEVAPLIERVAVTGGVL